MPDRHILWVNGEGQKHKQNWEKWQREGKEPWEREFAEFVKNGTIEAQLVTFPVYPPNNNSTYVTDKVHRSDFQRMKVLQEYGGIYLDCDVLVLQSVNELRKYHFVTTGDNYVNPDKNAVNARRLNTGIILSEPHARFMTSWLSAYDYDRSKYTWEHHASVTPYTLMLEYPDLIHIETHRLSPVSYGLMTSEAAAALTCGILVPSVKGIWYPTAKQGSQHTFYDEPDTYLLSVLEEKLMIHLTMSQVPKICMLRKWLGGPQDFSFMPSWLGGIFRRIAYGVDGYDYEVNEAMYREKNVGKALKLWDECRMQLGMSTPVARTSWKVGGQAFERQQLVNRHLP
jgi:hypothetical protein